MWACASFGVLAAPAARAAELSELTLAWQAPAGCPDRQAFLARVTELVGERRGEQSHRPLDVDAVVTLLPDGRFRAELGTIQAGSHRMRTLEAPSCSELTEASAVVIALAISPPAEPPEEEPAAPPPPVAAPLAVVPPSEPELVPKDDEREEARRRRRAHVRGGADAGLVTDFGTIAPVAVGLAVGIAGHFGPYLAHGVRVSFFPPRRSEVAGYPGQGADISLTAGALLGCFAPRNRVLEFRACGELELGVLHATGYGSADYYVHDAPWVALGAGLRLAYPGRGPLRAAASVDALFPTQQTEFVVTNVGLARKLPPVAGRAGLSLEWIFL